MLAVPAFQDQPTAEAATYLAATLHALAREERLDRRPRRLTEPGLATWNRFRTRLGPRDLVELILEDAAVTQPEPFAAGVVLGRPRPLDSLPDDLVEGWLSALPSLTEGVTPRAYVREQAARLGITARPEYARLRKLDAHHRALELPGTGGLLMAHVAEHQPDLAVKEVFTVACNGWRERALAGLVAVTLDIVGDAPIAAETSLAKLHERGPFTHVFGLDPERGGAHEKGEIEGVFVGATVVLV